MTTSDLPGALAPGTRLVHIGPHKTGSTAIQVAMHRARAALAGHGVCYPGTAARSRQAGWALDLPGRPLGTEPPPVEHWEALVAEVRRAGEQRVCISNEDFGRATDEQAARIIQGLGGDRVHVVAVARRFDRYLPSQWQERVKAGESRSFEDWLAVVLAEQSDDWEWHNVWRAHDIEALVHRWTALVGRDHFTLVVSDDRDHDLIPRLFERLLGVPAGLLAPRPGRSNRSLAWSEVELIRLLNHASVAGHWSGDVDRTYLKQAVVRPLRKAPVDTSGTRTPPLPVWAVDRVREVGAARIEALGRLGIRVVGDPELLRLPDEVALRDSTEPVPPLPLAVATRAIQDVIAAMSEARAAAQ